MDHDPTTLRRRLKKAGISDAAISAAWPTWWSDEAVGSASATAELGFSVARKLGISPRSLFDGRVEFIWKDEARFKHLSAKTDEHRAALASFGMSVGRLLASSTRRSAQAYSLKACALRKALLATSDYVDLHGLLALCWAIGIPVIHLRVFPSDAKGMHALVVRTGERFAVLIGRDAQYPAPVAFTLAHELGHIALDHLAESTAIVDLEDPAADSKGEDIDEAEADRFALELLTGRTELEFTTSTDKFGARQLASSVLSVAPHYRIEPGTLALCFAHRTKLWPLAASALQHIYASGPKPVWAEVNRVAAEQIDWSALGSDSAEFLSNIMGLDDV